MKRHTVTDRILEVCEWIESGRARELRERAGLTQAEVAQVCEVTQAAIFRWERGQRRPKARNAIAYHKLLVGLVAREQRKAA